MKNTIIIFLITTLFFSCNQKFEQSVDYTILKGKIKNSTSDTIIIRDNYWNPIDTIVIRNNAFNDTLKVSKGYYFLSYNSTDAHLFLKPTFNINIDFNKEGFLNSLNYSGNGGVENNYLADKDRLAQSLPLSLRVYSFYAKLDESNFLRQTDSISNLYSNLLKQSTELDNDFKLIESKSIQIDKALKLYQYEGQKRLVEKNSEFKISKDFPNPFKDIDLNNQSLMITYNYKTLVHSFINNKSMKRLSNDKNLDFFIIYQEELAKSKLSSEIRDILGLENVEYGFTYTTNIEQYRNTYLSFAKNQKYINKFNELYNIKMTEKGNQSADFKFEGNDGKTYELRDFRDKYIYIDLWASWCSPCIAQIPDLKKLEEKYSEKIHFISIAWNDDKTKWLNMIKKKDLKGVQLFATNKNADFFKFFNVKSIPRFILLDKEGKIIESNAKQPSESNLDRQLEALE